MIFDNNHPLNSRQRQLVIATSFCLALSTLAVALRLIARRKFGIKLWWDDYICVLALVGATKKLKLSGLHAFRADDSSDLLVLSQHTYPRWYADQHAYPSQDRSCS